MPCSPGLGLKSTVEDYLKPDITHKSECVEESSDSGDELDLSNIDDSEIDSYIMTPIEVKNKTKLWMKVNKEYLEEIKEKERLEKEERDEMIKQGLDPDKIKKKKTPKKKYTGFPETAVEAIAKMAEDKKISTKIDYNVLKKLNFVNTEGESIPIEPTAPDMLQNKNNNFEVSEDKSLSSGKRPFTFVSDQDTKRRKNVGCSKITPRLVSRNVNPAVKPVSQLCDIVPADNQELAPEQVLYLAFMDRFMFFCFSECRG